MASLLEQLSDRDRKWVRGDGVCGEVSCEEGQDEKGVKSQGENGSSSENLLRKLEEQNRYTYIMYTCVYSGVSPSGHPGI